MNNDSKNNYSNIITIIIFLTLVFIISLIFTMCHKKSDVSYEKDTQAQLSLVEDDTGEEETDESDINESDTEETESNEVKDYVSYYFRNKRLLNDHYNKHGIEMGFESATDYEKAASDVVNNENALHKTEAEDGDDVYYIEDTNEFVIVSTDGYIRTYFNPSGGIDYFNRQ